MGRDLLVVGHKGVVDPTFLGGSAWDFGYRDAKHSAHRLSGHKIASANCSVWLTFKLNRVTINKTEGKKRSKLTPL